MSADEPNALLVTKNAAGTITTITLNRPARKNAVDPAQASRLTQAFLDFEADDTAKVCVFHGTEGMFCAGADLVDIARRGRERREQGASQEDPVQLNIGAVDGRNQGPMGPSRMWIRKPVICAVSGYAVAGGLELSLLGDMRVVEEDAVFGVFCRRWGIPLIDGGTVRLRAVVGFGRAMDMILTGRGVGAQEAYMMGLANRVVPKGKSVEEATKIAEQLIRFPQGCLNKDRDSVYYAAYEAGSFEDAMSFEYEGGIQVLQSESIAGATRFSDGLGRGGSFEKL